MAKERTSPLEGAFVRRAREAAVEHWEYLLAGLAISAVLSTIGFFIVRAIIRRRRKTLWQRMLEYLEQLGRRREELVKRLKEAYEEVDTEELAKQVGGRIKNIEEELEAVDRAISAVKSRSRQLAKQVKR